jgi:hypothetical protein
MMIRQILASTLLLTFLAGCPANSSSGLASTGASDQSARAAAFEGLTVIRSIMYRDGGTMAIGAKLVKGDAATVRYDGKKGSETEGTFFVTMGSTAERRLDRTEAAPIVTALEKAIAANDPNADPRVVQPFIDKLKAFAATTP